MKIFSLAGERERERVISFERERSKKKEFF